MTSPSDGDYVPRPEDWVIVPNWDRFQHYKDRSPLWIKVYSKLLHDPRFLGLSLASRGLLVVIWLAYSQENGEISVRILNKLSGNRVSIPQLVALNQAGFIRFSASRPVAPLEEREKEIEREGLEGTKQGRAVENSAKRLRTLALDIAADWNDGSTENFDDALDALERKCQAKLRRSEREELWDIAFRR